MIIAQLDNNLINESAMGVHQRGKVTTEHWLSNEWNWIRTCFNLGKLGKIQIYKYCIYKYKEK